MKKEDAPYGDGRAWERGGNVNDWSVLHNGSDAGAVAHAADPRRQRSAHSPGVEHRAALHLSIAKAPSAAWLRNNLRTLASRPRGRASGRKAGACARRRSRGRGPNGTAI